MGQNNFDDIEDIGMDDNDDELSIEIELSGDEIEDTEDNFILSKHTKEGKHSLNHDSIFKGKKNNKEEDVVDEMEDHFDNNFKLDVSSSYHDESVNNEEYIRRLKLHKKVYDTLVNYTDINFMNNRRKPSKNDFNKYFFTVKHKLKNEGFSKIEIFVELSYYFSDNLGNMFKLLDKKYKTDIINELQEFIGRSNNRVVTKRNLHVNTEIRFYHYSEDDMPVIIDGIISETDYENSLFQVSNFVDNPELRKTYTVPLKNIKEILSNDRYKFNLNLLNDLDFL